jgi:hypothetical protein
MRRIPALALAVLLALPGAAFAAEAPSMEDMPGVTAPSGSPGENATNRNATMRNGTLHNATAAQADDSGVYRLDPLKVTGEQEQMGKVVLDGKLVNSLPSPGRTINDALRTQSDVQFDESAYSSMQGGEIRPPRVSIAGSRPYENAYLIDGISTENRLDPSGEDETTADGTAPTGEAQSFYIDTDLLDNITVFKSNIPAEYGGFTGGVVSADIKKPRTDGWHGFFKYRHTRNNWAEIKTEDSEDLDSSSTSVDEQIFFQRHDTSMALEGPINDNLAILLNYSIKHSIIPLNTTWGDTKNQYRTNENFLTKLALTPDDSPFEGTLTLGYAPYSREMYVALRRDSEFDVTGGGFISALEGTYDFGPVSWKNTLGFTRYELSRYGSGEENYTWRRASTTGQASQYATWASNTTYAMEGSFGDYEQMQDEITWKSVLEGDSFETAFLSHVLQTGVELRNTRVATDVTGSKSYSSPIFPTSAAQQAWINAADGAIAGEQYASRLAVLDPYSRETSANALAWFGQDTIKLGRLTLRPGLRVSYDDVSGNVDPAWRSMADLDVFADDVFHLIGGYNRYYGTQILTYALRQTQGYDRYSRTLSASGLSDWTQYQTGSNSYYNLGDLKTPYADELTGGFTLRLWDILFGMRVEEREHRDQIRTKTEDDGTKVLFNGGESDYWGITWEAERAFTNTPVGDHTLKIGITRSHTKTDGTDFDSSFLEGDTSSAVEWETVYFNGALIPRSNLPAGNYNRPWIGTLTHTGSFYENYLRWFNILRYKGPGKSLVSDGYYYDADGLRYNAYEVKTFGDSVTIDTAVEWDVFRKEEHTLTLTLEITNLLDAYSRTDTDGGYIMGRQYYAGFKYSF